MSDKTAIEWTDATWNVATGCTRVSPGCDHCYIERTPPFRMAGRRFDGEGVGSSTGVVLYPERLSIPLHWRKPRKVFVNSLSDLFVKDIPDDLIARVWAVMGSSAAHTFQVLTKRPARMRSLLSSADFRAEVEEHWVKLFRTGPSRAQFMPGTWPLPNVWGGVTVEDQERAALRIPILLRTPLAVRWLSCEPLLGAIDLGDWFSWSPQRETDIDWVVVGGESGPGARPMHSSWALSLRDQCEAAEVPFHFKQWGGKTPKSGGRILDGRTWDEYPQPVTA